MISILFLTINCLTTNCYALDPPPITPVEEFFIFNTHGFPTIPGDWHLTVNGAVANPLSLTLDDLMNYTPTTQMATLGCAWYTIAYPTNVWIGNANWSGVPLNTIIEEASPLGEAASISFYAIDGYTKGRYSLNEIIQRDDILLAYEMNGETLPIEQGYPVRLVVPGGVGYEWVQWLESIEITTISTSKKPVSFPIHARIFKPQEDETIILGTHTISGVAFVDEGREVIKVEVSTNGGSTWETAQLLNYFVPNVWKHWQFTWEITQVGHYQIVARAEDHLGNLQIEDDFLYGWSQLSVDVDVDYDNDVDGIPDSKDNCSNTSNPDQTDSDDDSVGDVCDNCPYDANTNQEDTEEDGIGDVCDECTDTDSDGYGNPGFPNTCDEDNCPATPNGPELGLCAQTESGVYRYSLKECTSDIDCVEQWGTSWTCLKNQEDNYPEGGNGRGDACEWCFADLNGDGKVSPGDAMIFLEEWKRKDCSGEDPCQADIDGDGKVYPGDTMILLKEWKRTECPVIE